MVDASIYRDTDKLVKIVWDEHKRLTNLDKHGMDFADLTIEFFEAATIYPGKGSRHVALGRLSDSAIVVIFTHLGTEAISIVSMRPASTRERSLLT